MKGRAGMVSPKGTSEVFPAGKNHAGIFAVAKEIVRVEIIQKSSEQRTPNVVVHELISMRRAPIPRQFFQRL